MKLINHISAPFRSDVRLISFWDVVSKGKRTASNNNLPDMERETVPPSPSTPAIIMYTSGRTGNPKGSCRAHIMPGLVRAMNLIRMISYWYTGTVNVSNRGRRSIGRFGAKIMKILFDPIYQSEFFFIVLII